jgi:hypothetical protein
LNFKRLSDYQGIRRQGTRGSGYIRETEDKIFFNLIPGCPDICTLIA